MNKEELKNYWVYGIIAIISIISLPVILNFILQISFSSIKVIGNENTWLAFWSSYSGSVIGSLITLFVLYKTLRQNQSNHYKQIDFQIATIKYQVSQEWINNLKTTLLDNLSTLNFEKIESLAGLIQIQSSNIDLIKAISEHEEKIKRAKTTINILYHNEFKHPEQIRYKEILEDLVNNNLKVLSAFKKYMITWEGNIERLSQINDLKESASEAERTTLEFLKQQGSEIGKNKKKEIERVMEQHKDNISLINKQLEKSSIKLIKFEEQLVSTGLVDKLK